MKAYTNTNWLIRTIAMMVFGFTCSTVHALGLGELNHKSYIGQPLSGVIEIVGDELPSADNLLIRQLNEQEAAAVGIDLISSSYRVRFEPDEHNGRVTAINVYSQQPIAEPYLSLLIELKWPGGIVFREYALLFDTPPLRTQSSAASEKPGTAVNDAIASKNGSSSRSNASLSLGSRYMVQPGDTLSGIVSKLDSSHGLSENELAEAVFRANPRAFLRGDINALKAGVRLNLPSQPTLESQSTSSAPLRTNENPSTTERSLAQAVTEKSGRLSLSEGRDTLDAGADYEVPQIQEQIDGTQEMIDMLVRENQDLRERIDKIETSEYLSTLTELVAMQRKQIEALREEFRAQAGAVTNSGGTFQEDGTSVAAPIPNPQKQVGSVPELSFSQKLAQNFWSFISLLILAFLAVILLCVYAVRKWVANQHAQSEYTQYRESIESSVDLDSFIGIRESAEIAQEESENSKSGFGEAIDSRRHNSLQDRLNQATQEEKRRRDDEVKERIRVKTAEYATKPASVEDTSVNFQVGIDEVIGLDEEVNELLSMAKIYCSAGKYSEARAILSAQHKEDSDPRLVDALEQIDKLERG